MTQRKRSQRSCAPKPSRSRARVQKKVSTLKSHAVAGTTKASIAIVPSPAPQVVENTCTSRKVRGEKGSRAVSALAVPKSSSVPISDASPETLTKSRTRDANRTSPHSRKRTGTAQAAASERLKRPRKWVVPQTCDEEPEKRTGMHSTLRSRRSAAVGLQRETSRGKNSYPIDKCQGRYDGLLPKHPVPTPHTALPQRYRVQAGVAKAVAGSHGYAKGNGDVDEVSGTPEVPVSIKSRRDYPATRCVIDKRELRDLFEGVREMMGHRAKRELFPPSQESGCDGDGDSGGGGSGSGGGGGGGGGGCRKRRHTDVTLVQVDDRGNRGDAACNHATATAPHIPSAFASSLISPSLPRQDAKRARSVTLTSPPSKRQDESDEENDNNISACQTSSLEPAPRKASAKVTIGFAPNPKRPRFPPQGAFHHSKAFRAVSACPSLLPALEVNIGGYGEQAMRAMGHLLAEGQPMEGLLAWSADSQCYWTTVWESQVWGTKRNVTLCTLRGMLRVMSAMVEGLELIDNTEGVEMAPPVHFQEHEIDLIEKEDDALSRSPRTWRGSSSSCSVDLGKTSTIIPDDAVCQEEPRRIMHGRRCHTLETLPTSSCSQGRTRAQVDPFWSRSSSAAAAAAAAAAASTSGCSVGPKNGSDEARREPKSQGGEGVGDAGDVGDRAEKNVRDGNERKPHGHYMWRKLFLAGIVVRRLDMENA